MPSFCVRQTELPSISRLAADVLYHPDRSARFYGHPFRDLASFQAAASEVRLTDDRRAALIAALRVQNPAQWCLHHLLPSSSSIYTPYR